MRIVQIIDSLEVGGAERMAVNYANALLPHTEFSGLVATRAEGSLKAHIAAGVEYLFLRRRRTLDYKALMALRDYCVKNRIEFIHAHSSSYFIATLVRLLLPRLRIVWHDHNGMSEFLRSRESIVLKTCSFFFKGIIVVNHQLKEWAMRELNCGSVIYLANFTHRELTAPAGEALRGTPGKRIVCLANLREQKDHMMLLEVARMANKSHPDWTFHLVGKDFGDAYSAMVKDAIKSMDLTSHVYIYGTRDDVAAIIRQADIAILTSKCEGLPVALLEFGLHQKAVVVTAVGEIPQIIQSGENGFMVQPGDSQTFYECLVRLILHPGLRAQLGKALHQTIRENNSEEAVIDKYLTWIKTL